MNMNFIPFALLLLGIVSSSAANEYAITYFGDGCCSDYNNLWYNAIIFKDSSLSAVEDCQQKCIQCTTQIGYVFLGVEFLFQEGNPQSPECNCMIDDGYTFSLDSVIENEQCSDASDVISLASGTGEISNVDNSCGEDHECWKAQQLTPTTTSSTTPVSEVCA